ncbi:type II secretion system F family protein [Helcococcus kunzii]|uniref:Type II secretion system protein GspF domain-containing protein n=1 Tax=Helcococcus kunzii ATCC 51366 TaxID=883114 RepID=H3NM60_9FIRM|nr:hypothetical protein [Helcococcus kunzii]EHR35469.1 hypothetical protein HMPREF9709_00421 [Helcococcus kunzii ATCC 51366]QUY64375.1 hypothetical protein GUI37_02120 [Helcococcus kunzii]QZO76789.1 hypothetical protein HIF96_01805 [Helcococcus kunzii]
MFNNKKIISFLISTSIIFLYSITFFHNFIISILISIILSVRAHKLFETILEKKDIKQKRIMFREFLDIFHTNIISGQNFYNSLILTSREIKYIFQENIYIIKYLDEMIYDIENGKKIETSLIEFKKKSNLEEISIFVDSIIISIKSGIDISKVVENSKNMLTNNISLELEMTTIVENSKRDFIIMCLLPLIVLLTISFTSTMNLTLIDYIIRGIVFVMFIIAFYIGNKIVNLEF